MSKEDIISYIAQNPALIIPIRALRDGPTKEETLKKFLSVKFKGKKISGPNLITALEDKKIIGSFVHKDDKIKYLLLMKDLYSIRVPPKSVLNLLDETPIPKEIKKIYKKQLNTFFKSYTKKKDLGDDLLPFKIFANVDLLSIVNILKKKIVPFENIETEITNVAENAEVLLKKLEEMEVVTIIKESAKLKKGWVFLKTDFEIRSFFPEYLIKNISIKLKDGLIDKSLALKSLHSLKNFYIINEDPEKFMSIKQEIKDLEESFESEESLVEDIKVKKIKKIIGLYDSIGDIDNLMKWQNKLEENSSRKE